MPNLGLHIGFALDCAERLGHPIIKDHLGSYLLGSTTPDMRLFVGWERQRTHFFKLATDPPGAGIPAMMEAHPHLRKSARLTRETVAFMLGYMSHLNVDEGWICQVYRRFFGRGSVLADDPLVQVLDRAFQFEMDRQERQRIVDLEGMLKRIEGAYDGVDVGFIDRDQLQQWQAVVINRTGRDLPWERFRGFLSRVYPDADAEEAERILATIPDLLKRTRDHIKDEEVRAFRASSLDAFVASATAYLNGGQGL